MIPTRIVLIPGWNEGADDLEVLVRGRAGRRGFIHYGFECTIFGEGHGTLRERIGQIAELVATLRAREPNCRIVAFGYSSGGLIARGFWRAYPERAAHIAATVQLGTPNAGAVTDDVGAILRILKHSEDVIDDLDIESPFMQWLNGTGGHWETLPGSKNKRWVLDREPWVAPAGAAIINLVGRMPQFANESDGVVLVDSGNLNGRMPHRFIEGKNSNHLNLSGMWNPFTLLLRRWRCDDLLWPGAVDVAAEFFRTH